MHYSCRSVRRVVRRILIALILACALSPLVSSTVHAQMTVRFVNGNSNDGLVAYWSFDENGGQSFRDSARLPNRGTGGVLLPGAGFYGSADRAPLAGMYFNPSSLQLDGALGIAQLPDTANLNLVDTFTVGGWIKRLADDGAGIIYLSGTSAGAWYFGFNQNNRLIFGWGDRVQLTASVPLTANQWHYVAVSKSNTGANNVRIWLDGVLVAAGSISTLDVPAGDKYIGGRPGDAQSTWLGRIDELRVYDRALQEADFRRFAAGSGCATDGTSWTTAYRWLTCAIAEVPGGAEVWIARGLYIPGILTDHTFQLRNNVDFYGGFAGNETSLDQRQPFAAPSNPIIDPALYTVLSGDVQGDDDPTSFANYGENNHHVLTGTGVATLTRVDGLVVTGGNAQSIDPEWANGGGLLNYGGRLALSNVAFVANMASLGGGVILRGVAMRLDNVTFFANNAQSSGGGIYVDGGTIALNAATFQNNTAVEGGALALRRAAGVVDNTRFLDNIARQRGGAMLLVESSTGSLTNDVFAGNQALDGGGVATQASAITASEVEWRRNSAVNGGAIHSIGSSVDIRLSQWTANQASIGGAVYRQGGSLQVLETVAAGNRSSQDAGALYSQGPGDVMLNRVHFYANSALGAGGAIVNDGTTDVDVVNAIFVGNSAASGAALDSRNARFALTNATLCANSTSGGASIVAGGSSAGAISNTILWGHTGAAFESRSPDNLTFSHNIVEGEGGSNPQFLRLPSPGDGDWSTLKDNDYGDLSFQVDSPAIDAGDNGAVPAGITSDVKGSSRFWDDMAVPDTGSGAAPLVDIGAHEYVSLLPFARTNGPYSGVEGLPIAVTGIGSGVPGGRIVAYAWDCEADGSYEFTASTPTNACTYVDNGTYTLQLQVTAVGTSGEPGGSADAAALVTVRNAPPIYVAPTSQAAPAGRDHVFDLGTFTDAGVQDRWQVTVNWGDGTNDTLEPGTQGALQKAHRYAAAGQYTIEVRVRDDDGDDSTGTFRADASNATDDADGDGIPNLQECPDTNRCRDTDGDGTPDYLDPDDDEDGILTLNELRGDSDGDSAPNYLDPDDENDTAPTLEEGSEDLDGDGIGNYLDPDDDGDGIPTIDERGRDFDGNGISDAREYTYRLHLSTIRR